MPPAKPATGRPNLDHGTVLNGIRWRLRTGVPRRDLPERYGKLDTVYAGFRRRPRAGIWVRVLAAMQAEGDARSDLDWTLHFIDGTIVRAHQRAVGAPKKVGAIKPSAAARAGSRARPISGPRAGASWSPSS